jgi:dihydrofolate reductase
MTPIRISRPRSPFEGVPVSASLTNPPLVIVVAVADNGVIGADGGMPWHVSGDLKRVKLLTMGKPLIMGRRTYESIGRPLPGRTTIVLTRDPNFAVEGVVVVGNFEAALEAGTRVARAMDACEIVAFGGAGVYLRALPLARRVYKTEVHVCPKGDTRFPDLDPHQWREISRHSQHGVGKDELAHDFVVLERIEPEES